MGHGVSTCATCDGYFFRGHEIAVVGGGDSAMEEAVFLTRFATQGDAGAPARHAARVEDHAGQGAREPEDRVDARTSEVEEIKDTGKGEVTGMVLRNDHDRREQRDPGRPASSSRSATRRTRRSSSGQLELDANGYIVTHDGAKTSVPGVFACGDVQDHVYRQAITAAGSGCMAAIDAEHYLDGVPEHLHT